MVSKVMADKKREIKMAVNILEVVCEHTVLKEDGMNYTGLCPFHRQKTPSFSVSESEQRYHCSECMRGGDVIDFLMTVFSLNLEEALAELSRRVGSDVLLESSKEICEVQDKLTVAHKLNRFVASYYHSCLKKSGPAESYLLSRGVTREVIDKFYVGCTPTGVGGVSADSPDSLAKHLRAAKAPIQLAVELGLIRRSQSQIDNVDGLVDVFRDRLIFPIFNCLDKVAGFAGRAIPLKGVLTDMASQIPKYLSSIESIAFAREDMVFGFSQARMGIRDRDEVILVDGFFDVLVMHAAGFENAVAICGARLTREHCELFGRICTRMTILTGNESTLSSIAPDVPGFIQENGLRILKILIPGGQTPEEVLAGVSGKASMKAFLGGAQPIDSK